MNCFNYIDHGTGYEAIKGGVQRLVLNPEGWEEFRHGTVSAYLHMWIVVSHDGERRSVFTDLVEAALAADSGQFDNTHFPRNFKVMLPVSLEDDEPATVEWIRDEWQLDGERLSNSEAIELWETNP